LGSTMLSTGQAAKLCSVTPNAVLKWVHEGKLPARRTAGGHFRIDYRDLDRFAVAQRPAQPSLVEQGSTDHRPFRYCWEHNGNGKLLDGCRSCLVYELRAQRCYEVIRVAPAGGHTKLFCKGTCEDCDYYRIVRQQTTNVLLITDNPALAESLKAESGSAPFTLETTRCEYTCSALVETFRPDYAVVDCAMGPERSRDICQHLVQDPRIPFVRVIMAAEVAELPRDCDHLVFATIEKPMTINGITGLIRESRGKHEGQSKPAAAGRVAASHNLPGFLVPGETSGRRNTPG